MGLIAAPALIGCLGPGRSWKEGDPFSLGVAAGCPSSDGFVLWTRLAPVPTAEDPAAPGGMTGGPVEIAYEIALDPEMRRIVRRGIGIAEPDFAYSVHVEVAGLAPGRPYWYRFTSGAAASRVGRAITLPAPGAGVDRLRLAVASCANYEHGYFAAYRHMADEAPDLAIFLGDYIYEHVDGRPGETVRRHSDGVEPTTLPTYRNRYTQYRLDADLQRLHAEVPALMTWDDHEVQNDYADAWSQTFDDPKQFLLRRAAAYQAYYEHMPLRPSWSLPAGPTMRVYDRFGFGSLAEITMLDGRQYRSAQACYGPPDRGGAHLENDENCPERRDPARTLLGRAQEAWLYDGLARSTARWNVIAQDVMMAQFLQKDADGSLGHWTDSWGGYPANRDRLLRHLSDARVANPVVLSGDIHSFWANDLKLDFDDAGSPVVATELIVTSISALPPPYEPFVELLPLNPHIRYFESRWRGFMTVDIAADLLTARFRAVSDARDPRATVSTLAAFAIEDGRRGVVPA
ncbi:MAG TPA: alkaline phosphatase D family protein [Alphaproteobacteria bacterium]